MVLGTVGRRGVLVAGVVAALLASVGTWAARLAAPRVEPEPPAASLPALGPEEERLAAALWPIHGEVKLAALRITFAGMRFASGAGDAAQLEAEIAPTLETLDRALDAVQAIRPPAALDAVHDRYRGAVGLYREAARTTLAAARADDRTRLLEAQQLSLHASEETLRVGDRLWPTEHKPH